MNQNWQSDKVVKLVSLESTMKLDSMLVALVVVPLLRAILLKYIKIEHFCMYESTKIWLTCSSFESWNDYNMDSDNRLLVDYVVDVEHVLLAVDVPVVVELIQLIQLQLLLVVLLVLYQNEDMA